MSSAFRMTSTSAASPTAPASIFGLAAIVRQAYEGGDLTPLLETLAARVERDPDDAGALLDLSVLMHAAGQPERAAALQAQALALQHVYRRQHGDGGQLSVLALVAPGDFMANTPLDFLLEGSNITLWSYYIDAGTTSLADAPEHDVVFLALGESEANLPLLRRASDLLRDWKRPVVNAATTSIADLTRDAFCQRLEGERSLLAPRTVRISRYALAALAEGAVAVEPVLPGARWPLTVRPVGTHAGQGLEKVDGPTALAAYLATRPEERFYLAPFVDYAGRDGLYRKQRIAFIDGKAYPSHLAASDYWMVHYLSAQMTERPERRAEEEAWMRDFDTDFAVRHAKAFKALHQRLGLDYFGIDCAETRDGRLLVFEADVAMIVHALDPAGVFPYKKPAMERLFSAFVEALVTRAAQ